MKTAIGGPARRWADLVARKQKLLTQEDILKTFFTTFMLLFGCSSAHCCTDSVRPVLLGALVGASGGHVMRYYMGGRNKKRAALNTALLMGFIGGVSGCLIHQGLKKRDERIRREVLFDLNDFYHGPLLPEENFRKKEKDSL